jgi:hypothetical protein
VTSPCSAWATYADLPEGPSRMFSPTEWCGFLSTATDILWSATGRRWRGAEQTETVALRAAPPRAGEGSWPYSETWGQCPCYLGVGYGSTGWVPQWRLNWIRHTEPVAVRFPRSDVTGITTVLLDGGVFTGWALDGSWLARTDGRTWPVCGDRTSVTYTFGRPPPIAGVGACVTLAVELARYASPDPDEACQLPRRLTSVTRQGISFAAIDDLKFLDDGLTGLYSVDAFIRATNPKGRMQTAAAWSPDLPISRRKVGLP